MSSTKRMNINSLENLRIPNGKRYNYQHQYKIPMEKIDELFSLLANGVTLKKASGQTGMCFDTAKKYFDRGDPKRGIKPLSKRLTIYQEKISEKLSGLCEEKRMENLENVNTLISAANKYFLGEVEVEVIAPDGTKTIEIRKGQIQKFTVKDYERLVNLQMKLMGMAPSGDGAERIKETRMLTADEMTG